MLDKLNYPRYEPNNVYSYKKHPSREDMPYLLEHVFDLETGDYVTNHNQCCYYNPVDTKGMCVESLNDGILEIDGTDLVAVNNGKTSIIITDKYDYQFKINVIVYNKNYNKNLLKKNLVLKRGTVIDLDYVLKHVYCSHYDNCLFKQQRLINDNNELTYTIKEVKTVIKDYNNILVAYRNGEIIYHPLLDDYYEINVDEGNGYRVDVRVKDNFTKHIKSEIRRLEFELRDYQRMVR